jgi:hypothetical protein
MIENENDSNPESSVNPEMLQEDTQMSIGNPANPPSEEFMQKLSDFMEDDFNISAAYIFLMGTADKTPALTIGVQFEMPVEQSVVEELSGKVISALQPIVPEQPLGMLELSDPEMIVTIKEFTQPFFYR